MNSCRSIELAACDAAVDHVQHRHGQRRRGLAAEVAVERLRRPRPPQPSRRRARRRGSRSRRGVPLFGVPSSSISFRSSACLVERVQPGELARDLAVHVRDRLRDALAAPLGAAVAQLDRLVHAGRGARGHRGAPERAGARARRRPPPSGCRASRGSGGRARRLIALIRVAPLPGRSSGPARRAAARSSARPARRGELARRARPASTKRVFVAAERELGIDVQPAREVDDREEQVADLVRDRCVGLGLGARLAACARPRPRARRAPRAIFASGPVEVGPVEAGGDGAPLQLPGLQERRQRRRARRGRSPRGPPART